MEKRRGNFWYILFIAVIIGFFAATPVSNAATISGTVYKEDGSSPVNDATIAVNLYEGAPCGTCQVVAQDTTSDGSFEITGVSPGVYYIKAEKVSGTPGYIDEWWADAASIWDCWGAEAVTINTSGDVLSNKNFQLELYGSISGALYDATGNPITQSQILDVTAFRGSSCENSEYIGVQGWLTTNYTLTNVPPGTYYVKSSNKGSVWYVDEYHTVSGSTNNGVSYTCDAATQVIVNSGMNTPNIDFQLDSGGRISGTVYKSDGTTPITDADIRIFAYEGDPCDHEFADGTMTSNGSYIIAGIPAGSYYIQAFRESGANYMDEWYNVPLSSNDCNDADPVQVWVGVETQNIHFQLDSGGSITGTLVDETGQPLGNLKVDCSGNVPGGWQQTWSDPADGTFTLFGLGVGNAQITILSDPGRYLSGFIRNYYLAQGENKDIGTLTVQKGAVISGMVAKEGVPIEDLELSVGAKLILAEVDTGADGTFSFVLPPGEFTINTADSMDSITTVPQTVVVANSDIMTHKIIPTIAAYDVSNGDIYDGTVTINTGPPTGAGVMVLSFMNDQSFNLNNWGAMSPLSIGGLFDGLTASNPYQLTTPPGSTVQLMLSLYSELNDGNQSFTLIESTSDVSGGGTYNYIYNNIGSTVDGYVTRNGEPVFWASVVLYRESGNELVGFATTDHTGHYILYNVVAGTYYLEATAEDYDYVDKTLPFLVNNNLTVPDIELRGRKNELAADFGASGLWHYDGTIWTKKTSWDADDDMAGWVGWTDGLAADFGTNGLWNYDGLVWSKKTSWDAGSGGMAGWAGGLAVDFDGNGLWNYDGSSWTKKTNWNADDDLAGWAGGLAVDFGASGLWNYDGSTWTKKTGWNAGSGGMAGWAGGLAADFDGNGLWNYDGSSWSKKTSWDVGSGGMAGWAGGLAVDFDGSGLWNYDGSTWTKKTGLNPEGITALGDGFAADFGASGLWYYDGATWSKKTNWNAENLTAVDLY